MIGKLRELDAFPKTLDEFVVRTESGGVVTLIGISICWLLFLGQVWDFFLTNTAYEEVIVDTGALRETLTIHFDITFPKLSCTKFAMATVDASGLEQSMFDQSVYKLSLDEDGYAVGHAVQQDGSEQTMLYKDELQKKHDDHVKSKNDNAQDEKFKPKAQHTACGSCYGVVGVTEPMKCCNTCEQVRKAFAFRGWEWRTDGENRFWQCREEHVWAKVKSAEEHRELENKPEKGCELFGSVFVAKAKGSIHVGVTQTLHASDMLAIMFGLQLSNANEIDMSHQIHSLWFGGIASDNSGEHEYARPEDGFAALKSIDSHQSRKYESPLLGLNVEVKEASTVKYFVKVVGTDVVLANGTTVSSNQYSATENIRKVGPGALPSLHIFYDTPPLRLRFSEKHRSWGDLHTNMLALFGGVFAFMGIVDSLVYKKKFSRLKKVVRGK